MIKVIGTIGSPVWNDPDQSKALARAEIFRKYKIKGKIKGDFIVLSDTLIEINFTDLTSAQAFVAEMQEVYAKYNDTLTVEYV
jgi:predicted DNA repair protein MutK